ncbi:MAG: nuclease [Acidobacteriales bacterium]|nr:nuclease [Terriglobales bacterium]
MTMKLRAVFLFAVLGGAVQAQQPVGSVAVGDAVVTGNLSVTNGRAVLVSNSTVTAKDHSADISLDRGGNVLVCATSGLHITSGKAAAGATPLMLSLDRGAIELRMAATASDVIMTPDLRFGVAAPGPLDLRLGVTKDGDTCVDNRGGNAPVLNISDTFGESSYNLRPGQHVLFEHGNLKQVVDNESSPCGCPAAAGVSLADAAIASAKPASIASKPVEGKPAEEEHPFPAAVSAGLAPTPAVPKAPAGVVHAQVATTLSYDAAASGAAPAAAPANAPERTAPEAAQSPQPAASPAAPPSPDAAAAPSAEPPASPHSSDVAHWIGRFFKRIFGRG